MDVVMMNIKDVKPYEKNPRINDNAVEAVANSIKEFGWRQPIVVDKDNVIIAGHTRWKAAKRLKMKEVPVIVASDLTDEQVRAYRIADNSTGELATWDYDLLMPEIADLDFDMSMFGLEIPGEETAIENIVEDDYEPPEELTPVVKLGEIWRCGDHVLLCGDATNEDDVRKLVEVGGGQVSLVLTDPPYGIDVVNNSGVLRGQGSKNQLAPSQAYQPVIGDETTETAEKSYKILKKVSDKLILWGGNYFIDFLEHSHSWIIWNKKGGEDQSSTDFADGEMAWCSFHTPLRIFNQMWRGCFREGEHDKRVHPTQKPVRTLAEIIDRFSEKNDTILDVFGGSGSTMIACEEIDRKCLMMELDHHYCDVIIDRWEQYTGRKAEKVVA